MKLTTFKNDEGFLFASMLWLPFNDITDPSLLNEAFLFLNGEKELSTRFIYKRENEEPSNFWGNFGRTCELLYKTKWENAYKIFTEDLQTLGEKTTYEETNNASGDTTNKVSAFDSEDLVSDSGINSSNEGSRNYTLTKTSGKLILENIELLEDNVLYKVVFKDVKTLLLKSIY